MRAFKKVGGTPVFIEKGSGSVIYDVEGKQYIDYVCSWGPLILGHAHPEIVSALKKACERGTTFGTATEKEAAFAQMIADAVPSIEKVRLVNSGTEATMSAIRLARGFTGRDNIVKFEGCYHGHSDCLLVKAGSGAATFGIPDSLGVPADFTKHTLTVPFNDSELFEKTVGENYENIACVIIEPIAGNIGVIPPKEGFLQKIRELCTSYEIILIFDEVITGFRVSYGGAQELYSVMPDMTTLGKIIGGGLPIGAFGGKAEIMDCLTPDGKVYQAGTLSGNPLAVSAGIETLKILADKKVYHKLEKLGSKLSEGLKRVMEKNDVSAQVARVGSMMSVFFTDREVIDYQTAMTTNVEMYSRYFHNMLDKGIYLAPSPYESAFVSAAHTEAQIDRTIEAADESMKKIVG